MPIETSGVVPEEENENYQSGLTQENLEDLRSEYTPIGIEVDTLPDPSEVRDFTTAVIHHKDAGGVDTINLYLMTGGKWWNLNEYQELPTGAFGGADQFDTSTVLSFTGGTDVIEELTTNWTAEALSHIKFNSGVFIIQKTGHYKVSWSCSFASAGSNKDYEAGILLNYEAGQKPDDQIQQGWAHRKIGSSSDLGNMSAKSLIELRAGDKISLGMACESSPVSNAIIQHMSFTIFRIR